MNLDSDNVRILAIFAHILEIIAILGGAIWGFFNKSKSVIGFMISRFISFLLKIAIIIFFSIFVVRFTELVFQATLIPLIGHSVSDYWENGKEWQFILAYFIWIVLALTIIWIIGTLIWTWSFKETKLSLFNLFLPKNKKLSTDKTKKLSILNAKYGANQSFFDVTDKLKRMVIGNSLNITASNDLAGDPIVGILKKLLIEYKYDGEPQNTIEITEGTSKTI
jgi:hypothetical protein